MKNDLENLRHSRSKKDFPEISLEEDEYVILKIKRSGILPVLIWAGVALAGVLLIALNILVAGTANVFSTTATSQALFSIIVDVVFGVILIAALISTHVYNLNRLFITNKRVIQNLQTSLFAGSTNVIDLVSIEDVSFKQSGIWDHILKTGTLRMSTIGDETTYTFTWMDEPNDELETITHLVHVAKEDDDDKEKEK